jgi:adenylylsulfate reductase subunit B
MPPVIKPEKCIRCAKCAELCSEDVFFGSPKKAVPVVKYPDDCWHCGACVENCPVEGAIKLRIPLTMTLLHK